MTRTPWLTLLDLVYLLALALFAIVGSPLAPFHGDEPMQIYMSEDYETAFVERNPRALEVRPPYEIDNDFHLRILNGSVNRYTIGFARSLAGIGLDHLPPRPGWDWGLSYADNAATGHVPSDALMQAGRFPSTLFLAGSIFVMFGLARVLVDDRFTRPFAYIVTGLYALNPIILLNGRRALQEGSLLFFGLLMLLTAAVIARRLASGKQVPIYVWVGLILAGAMSLASKHNGIVFVAAALGWIFIGELTHFRLWNVVLNTLRLVVSGLLIVVLFVALSPALWNDPIARLGDLLTVRAQLLDMQSNADPLAPTTLEQRVEGIVTQPFMTPLAHYEVASWATFEPVPTQIAQYMASPISGVQFGSVIGLVLTVLAAIGILVLFVPRLRPTPDWATSIGILVWMVAVIATLLVNPLPWQRYYLPLIPVASVLVGVGLMGILRAFRVR